MAENQTLTVTAPPARRSLMIRNLMPGLTERGKIKIGRKGREITSKAGNTFRVPEKLDHFLVTTLERDQADNFVVDQEIHTLLKSDKPTEIPIRLLYDDIELNFQSRYAAFIGKKLWCSGDGVEAQRMGADGHLGAVVCPCERQEPSYTGKDKCKINGTLNCIIDGAPSVGGIWRFRTTSYNSVVGLMSSLALIKSITGGKLAGIPLMLKVGPKTVTSPVDQKVQTIYVVSLEFKGTPAQLQEMGYKAALEQANHNVRIEHIEQEARQLLAPPSDKVFANDPDDVVEEFYPPEEEVAPAGAAAAKPKRTRRTKAEMEADRAAEDGPDDGLPAQMQEAVLETGPEPAEPEPEPEPEPEQASDPAAQPQSGNGQIVYIFTDSIGEVHECAHSGDFTDMFERAVEDAKDEQTLKVLSGNNLVMLGQLGGDPSAITAAAEGQPESKWADELRAAFGEKLKEIKAATKSAGRQPASRV